MWFFETEVFSARRRDGEREFFSSSAIVLTIDSERVNLGVQIKI